MSRNPHDIVKAPVITEESTIQSETRIKMRFASIPGPIRQRFATPSSVCST